MFRISLLLIVSLFLFSNTVSALETSSPIVELKNQYSGKCLTVKDGSVKHGAALIHRECGSGINMIWEMRPEGPGYRIVNQNSGLCLGVEHQSKKDGMRVTQVSPCNRPDTLWMVGNAAPAPSQRNPLTLPVDYGKTIVISNSNSNKCLALVTGTEIKQYGCTPHRPKTTWQLVEPPSNDSSQIAGRVKIIDFEKHLMPFYQNGKTYLFGLGSSKDIPYYGTNIPLVGEIVSDNAANWWVVNDDPKTGVRPIVQRDKMSSAYVELASFTLNDHAYIFGLHRGKESSVGANIWRINDDPSTGFQLVLAGGKMSAHYRHVVSFQLKGEPYILGLHWDLGANIWRIKEGAKGLTMELVKYKAKMSSNHEHLEVFYMDGHPYIFGVHTGSGKGVGANIWRVQDDPSQGLELVLDGDKTFPHHD
ncbi:MAG: RICIN domain-containing protein [Syntrophotaleaceae bacterium]